MQKTIAEALRLAALLRQGRLYYHDGLQIPEPNPGKVQNYKRLLILLSGNKNETISRNGKLEKIHLCQGDALLVEKGAWEEQDVCTEHEMFCIVPKESHLHLSYYHFPAGMKRGDWVPPISAINTEKAPSERLWHLIYALSSAETEDPKTENLMIRAVASCALSELEYQRGEAGHYSDFDEILAFVDSSYMHSLNRRMIAERFGYNENYISQLFPRMTGRKLHEYIESLRMDSAKAMLLNSRTSIKEIAYSCHFSNEAYFIQRFRMLFGVSPGNFRKNNK